MKRSIKISAEMYKLLIERTIDDFSVTELRDEFIVLRGFHIDADEARKKSLSTNLAVHEAWLA